MAHGNGIVEVLEAGLQAAGLRGKVLSHNVANLHTPGYRRGEVRFEELLAKAMAGGGDLDMRDVRPEVVRPGNTAVDPTGNDVDLNVEIGQMIENGEQTRVMLRSLAKLYSQVELATRDR